MHPNTFANHFQTGDLRDEVFVIMSFHRDFNARWEQVIRPAIEEDCKLAVRRVDFNTSGESIIHDIIDGIAHAKIVLADITSIPMVDPHKKTWPQRNANVLWEVGIAHTMRLPDETILVKSDNDDSIFDLTQFRAFPYDPDGSVTAARDVVSELIKDRIGSVKRWRSKLVQRCASMLDPASVNMLLSLDRGGKAFEVRLYSLPTTVAVSRLYSLGLAETCEIRVDSEQNKAITRGRITQLGRDVQTALVGFLKANVPPVIVRRPASSDKSTSAGT